ncbi:hypothetical protein [Heliorestis convoluta]|uniref:Uncharacterized protein n=1 Tax=Heliorestis convoluta TaxID=356322 RepID=A0A5Q2N2H6_9FIRM|nr:hypothetical protein [Heliorestis convoluta]QGG49017.1 hypothetical protein FTV88_2928 [Heliorestis convoluta]
MGWNKEEDIQLAIDAIKLMLTNNDSIPQYVIDIYHGHMKESEEEMVLCFYKNLEEEFPDMLRFFAPQGEQVASSS